MCVVLRIFWSVALVTCVGLPAAAAQETEGSQEEQESEVSQEEVDEFNQAREAAERQRIDAAVETDQTGTDPRAFTNKFMPYSRYTELENGTSQLDSTLFGTVGFGPEVGMIYEIPVAQRRDRPRIRCRWGRWHRLARMRGDRWT